MKNFSVASSTILNCVQSNTGSSQPLTINLDTRQMTLGALMPFKIENVEETAIYSTNHSDGIKRYLAFKRYSGDLSWTIINPDGTVHISFDYICSSAKKVF
jgi:hypothetical protein